MYSVSGTKRIIRIKNKAHVVQYPVSLAAHQLALGSLQAGEKGRLPFHHESPTTGIQRHIVIELELAIPSSNQQTYPL